ncbi:biotin biosynthesis protein BioC [Nitrosococcus halophilus Nc 4]|uniref:Malonyl-[acyl-carrier protein] O-methyltransferase n=1 Tax=Nitrosococcus halophilus (strain Nc4) TaxID=472759 RepID=D5BXI9_NITHN|nr:malonyl-ACP O-methyltransferase BioC [Nitrosococcus halophilus]ADE13947.1 biotin biosynthesis protein BioC [Nitrosococcus halophilus Nc 4]
MNPEYGINKRQVSKAFNRAAARYDQVAVLQRMVGEQLLERLELVKLSPAVVVDVGAGTGLQTIDLLRRYGKAQVMALDLAPEMLHEARRRVKGRALERVLEAVWPRRHCHFVCGDTECLPFANQSVDLIFSNLTLQWCSALDSVFTEFRRILKPGGLLTFTTLGPDTLKELRAAWSSADAYRHVNPFVDMHDIGDGLVRAGLAEPVMDVEHYTFTYPDVYGLMRDLKLLGAQTVGSGRQAGLMGKNRRQKMMQSYEAFREGGRLPASFEVVYGHAWGVEQTLQQRTADGAIQIPLHALKGRSKPIGNRS